MQEIGLDCKAHMAQNGWCCAVTRPYRQEMLHTNGISSSPINSERGRDASECVLNKPEWTVLSFNPHSFIPLLIENDFWSILIFYYKSRTRRWLYTEAVFFSISEERHRVLIWFSLVAKCTLHRSAFRTVHHFHFATTQFSSSRKLCNYLSLSLALHLYSRLPSSKTTEKRGKKAPQASNHLSERGGTICIITALMLMDYDSILRFPTQHLI